MDRRTVSIGWFGTLAALAVLGLTTFAALLGTAIESESVFWDGEPTGACFGWPSPTGDLSFPLMIAIALAALTLVGLYFGFARPQLTTSPSKRAAMMMGGGLVVVNLIAAVPLGYLLHRAYRVSQTCDNPVTDIGPTTVGQAFVPVAIVSIIAAVVILATAFVTGVELKRTRTPSAPSLPVESH